MRRSPHARLAAHCRAGLALLALGLPVALTAQAATEVNDANQAELEMVQGIGPRLSEQILAARRQGRFRDWDDLIARLSGIGPARAARLSGAGLTVEGHAWPPAAASAASGHR